MIRHTNYTKRHPNDSTAHAYLRAEHGVHRQAELLAARVVERREHASAHATLAVQQLVRVRANQAVVHRRVGVGGRPRPLLAPADGPVVERDLARGDAHTHTLTENNSNNREIAA